jgi:integrase
MVRIGTPSSAWENAVKRSGLVDVTFHTLRHTFGSWLTQHGLAAEKSKRRADGRRSRWPSAKVT